MNMEGFKHLIKIFKTDAFPEQELTWALLLNSYKGVKAGYGRAISHGHCDLQKVDAETRGVSWDQGWEWED